MGISPFVLFLRKHGKDKSLKSLSIPQRGKKLGEMYRKLKPADKADLVKKAKATAAPKRTKVSVSVIAQGLRLGIPAALVKKSFHSTKGSSTLNRLRKIAAKNKIKVRKPRRQSSA